ncbi:MAG: ABC transporter ATP-binding protein [Shimia sp.]|nr:ABC transporter ATP-binding protein [Shimia sp.]MCP4823312.1 ABC transporter ATP-binding protein [Shimia sp.]|mmetsp:Transcript_24104/g.44720  ORF Transcript_24104/g.44720 Transcript_24104/m.44720 type:complete len:231 (+) Transcript_24104:2778-3470(+)
MSQISVSDFSFVWPGSSAAVLQNASLNVEAGERVMLRGPSGSGKSTLLAAISGVIDIPKRAVTVAGQDIGALPASKRDRFRADHMGLIFQVFNLVPWLSAVDNILLPCRFSKRRRDRIAGPLDKEAHRLMAALGLKPDTLGAFQASTLSVGQQQRVAAARALIGAPEVILADEPTSALDPDTKDSFMQLLSQQAQDSGAALLMVSHDEGLDRHFDRVVEMSALSGVGAYQ